MGVLNSFYYVGQILASGIAVSLPSRRIYHSCMLILDSDPIR